MIIPTLTKKVKINGRKVFSKLNSNVFPKILRRMESTANFKENIPCKQLAKMRELCHHRIFF